MVEIYVLQARSHYQLHVVKRNILAYQSLLPNLEDIDALNRYMAFTCYLFMKKKSWTFAVWK